MTLDEESGDSLGVWPPTASRGWVHQPVVGRIGIPGGLTICGRSHQPVVDASYRDGREVTLLCRQAEGEDSCVYLETGVALHRPVVDASLRQV